MLTTVPAVNANPYRLVLGQIAWAAGPCFPLTEGICKIYAGIFERTDETYSMVTDEI
jgi:hypothetical protein